MKTHEATRPRGTATSVPTSVEPALRGQWEALTTPGTPTAEFGSHLLAGLPAPVRRWLAHAIAPGTPLRHAAVLHQHGQIKIGRWWPYQADWALAPSRGFIWTATTRMGPVYIRGFDRYTRGTGEMRWHLFGLIPLITETGPDVTRSAVGRLAGELCFVPAAALAPELRWQPVNDDQATATLMIDGYPNHLTITVDEVGALKRVDVLRWGRPGGKAFGEHLFTALLDGPERTFDGYTIPVTVRAGWGHCPDGCATEEFIRFNIDQARFW